MGKKHRAQTNGSSGKPDAEKKAVGNGKGHAPVDLRRGDPLAAKGTLFIIGGREDKHGDKVIMRSLAQRVGAGPLVISTLATVYEEELWQKYRDLFCSLGVKLHVLSQSDKFDLKTHVPVNLPAEEVERELEVEMMKAEESK
jgi:hypothetical protein